MYKVNKILLCFLITIILILSCSCGDTSYPDSRNNQITEKTSATKLEDDIPLLESNPSEEMDSLPNDESNAVVTDDSSSYLPEETAVVTDDSSSDLPEESEEGDPSSIIPMERFYIFGKFSGGVAWLGRVNPSHHYLVDTTGKAILDFDGYVVLSDFNNGYSHIQGFGADLRRIFTIDTSGNITADLTLGENEKIVVADGGYVFTREYVADFDSSGFEYKIYGPSGNVIKEFYSEKFQYIRDSSEWDYDFEPVYCSYVGNDCIRLGGELLYFIEDDRFISINDYDFYMPDGMNKNIKFHDGYAYVGKAQVSKDDYSIRLVFLKETGDFILITLPFDHRYTNINLSDISEGYCAFLDGYYDEYEDREGYHIVAIDLHNATYDTISTEFDDKLEWRPEMCGKNIVISMTGKDGEDYYAVVDINGQTICSPKKGHYYTERCVYNSDATPIFDLAEKGFPDECTITNYNDGIVLVSKMISGRIKFARYADENGDQLFEYVDVSSAKVVSPRDEQ